ncbi:MAG: SRPBCC domain-containing protein [Anaerolineae bacterium]|nr:SRPBCC domain-containing protein [Anaerolineae bacterium]
MSVPVHDVRAPAQLPSAHDRIVIAAQYPNITPELLFDYFVRPNLICRWWAPSAEAYARLGGTFHFAWPELDLHLRGRYTFVERGKRLAFTWKWDHETRAPRSVVINFEPCADGALVRVVHKPYTPQEGQERKQHAEAWLYYLAALQKLTRPAPAA